jgi:bifunctional UDP-N-acetylglucosamine pyrophosphorylase/glucosamine-1-phosphate N-acetyltransferase
MIFTAIILAAGEGKRMNSELPKVLHCLSGVPMIIRIIKEIIKLSPKQIIVVLGKKYSMILETIEMYGYLSYITPVYQFIPQGTGDALMRAIDSIEQEKCLVLCGDIPLISSSTMSKLLKYDNVILSKNSTKPYGYGRIVKEENYCRIIEEKECNENQKMINLINTGIYCLEKSNLLKSLPLLKNNNVSNEYYLTDIFSYFPCDYLVIEKDREFEVEGVNTPKQLKDLEKHINK